MSEKVELTYILWKTIDYRLVYIYLQKGTEICNYSYPNTILAVKLNRVVSPFVHLIL